MTSIWILSAVLGFLAVGTVTANENDDQRPLQVFPIGRNQTASTGKNKMLTCRIRQLSHDSHFTPDLQWWHQPARGEKVRIREVTGRLYIEFDGPQVLKLYITKIDEQDAGTYSCVGRIEGNDYEEKIKLLLYKDITFDNAPTPQHPRIYDTALILCKVSGQPVPQVNWKYKGTVIQTGGRYVLQNEGLEIKNITEEDNGLYQCRAEVQADGRLATRDINVVVHIPPKVISGPGQLEGIEEHEVSLECAATGKPDAKWEFFKDDSRQPISGNDRRIVDEDAGVIHFRPLHRDDDGKYTCTAINTVGSDSADGNLEVIVRPKILEFNEVKGEEGKATTIHCKTEGSPPPQMTFRKVGNAFDFEEGENDNGRIIVEKVDSRHLAMTINNLRPEDTANYTCTSKNTGGQHALNSTITVEYRPRFPEDHLTSVYSWAGKTRNMTCNVMAEPSPIIRWKLFGKELKNNETFKIYSGEHMGKNSALQITVREEDQVWIYNYYTCEATNGYGIGEMEIKLDRATVPGEPGKIEVTEDSPTMVVLRVTSPDDDGGVPIYAYRVEYEQHVQDYNLGQEIRIENLRPSTQYLFRTRAKNEVGVGNPKELTHTTESIRIPYPVVIISDPQGLYPHKFTINWERPKTGGLPIKQYKISYRRVQLHSDGTIEKPLDDYIIQLKEDSPEAPILYYDLNDLKSRTDYQIEVSARNDMGFSIPNEEFVFQTAEDPNPPPISGQATDTDNEIGAVKGSNGMGTAAVIAVVVAVFFIFLIIVDISCYFINSCGVLMCICVSFCGKRADPIKEKQMEEGERLMGKPSPHMSKEVHQPPIEEARVATDTQATPPMQQVEEENEEPVEEKVDEPEEEPGAENSQDDKEALKEELAAEEDADEKTPLQANEAMC